MKTIYRCLCMLFLLAALAGCGEQTPAASPASAPPPPENTPLPPPENTPLPPPTPVPATETTAPLLSGNTYTNPVTYQVTYTIAVRPGSFNFDQLKLYQPKPVEWDAQKDLTIDEVSPPPTQENLDALGNGIYYWELAGTPEPGKIASFTIKFTFTAYETLTSLDPAAVLPYDTASELYLQYTRPERFIESDAPAIQAKAAGLAAGETNPLLLARKFYDYVIDSSRYELKGEGLAGAQDLLTGGYGECGDYASLFVALSRASGIPARPIVGYWAVTGTNQTHVWAEFYLEGLGWVPVDPTIGQSDPAKRNYYFGSMDNQRVILNKGFNLVMVPAAPDNYIAPFLQVPLYWYWGSGDDTTVSLERIAWSVVPVP